jgi:zinc transport system permease protein
MESMFETAASLLRALLPFEWASADYMIIPMLATLIVMPLTALVGVVVVNGRMAFFTSAIAHSAFTGVALGVLMSTNPTWVMVAFGALLALMVTWLQRRSAGSLDSLVGVVQTLSVAAGLVIVSALRYQRLDQFLYGSVLWATKSDLAVLLAAGIAVLLFMALAYNRLLMIGLSPQLAKAWGIRTFVYEYLFSLTVAVIVMLGIQIIGVLLISAAVIIPAAAGRNFAWSAGSMMWTSIAISVVSGVMGIALSYQWESVTGGTIVLVAGGLFVLSVIYRGIRGRG